MTVAGTYLSDTAGFFITREGTASVEPSITIANVTADKIAVQKESESYWLLRDMLGEDAVQAFSTLREAIDALEAGTVSVAAGDALIGAYIARDHPSVVFAGQLAAGVPLGAVVAADNTALSDAVRASLDQLATDGVLDFIRTKWVGELPEFSVEESSGATVAP
jgi:ABC-type amino acid transport substrate-binding protein